MALDRTNGTQGTNSVSKFWDDQPKGGQYDELVRRSRRSKRRRSILRTVALILIGAVLGAALQAWVHKSNTGKRFPIHRVEVFLGSSDRGGVVVGPFHVLDNALHVDREAREQRVIPFSGRFVGRRLGGIGENGDFSHGHHLFGELKASFTGERFGHSREFTSSVWAGGLR